jgi:hypothetical protein
MLVLVPPLVLELVPQGQGQEQEPLLLWRPDVLRH